MYVRRPYHPCLQARSFQVERNVATARVYGPIVQYPERLYWPIGSSEEELVATVWAHFNAEVAGFTNFGDIDEDPRGEWSHVRNFSSGKELVAWMSSSDLQSSVTRLNIHCHGLPGELVLDSRVNVGNVSRLRSLGDYLQPGAKLLFSGCSVGLDDEGSEFLVALSNALSGRIVIGFESVSVMGEEAGRELGAGDVHNGGGTTNGLAVRSGHTDPDARVTAWSHHAKWAYDGTIVRYPAFEQARRRKYPGQEVFLCANPDCNGHGRAYQQCSRWHPACDW
jgi:hypothetical protein